MTLEEITQRINTIVDQLLVNLAEDPEQRYLFTLPSLAEGVQKAPVLDCLENGYCIARLREVITYKYLLEAFKSKQLEISKENLYACISNMRTSPVIDYYDLGNYHEFAVYYYTRLGNKKKANRHLLSCYMDRGRAILSCDKTFDSKDLLMVILKNHQRLRSFLLYIIDFIYLDFEEVQPCLQRSQYLLLERALVLASKLFAENPACNKDLRCCVYYVMSLYYDMTNRAELAQKATDAYMELGINKNYDEMLQSFMANEPSPYLVDERFLDYLLYAKYIGKEYIYGPDDEEEDDDEISEYEEEIPVVEKDGRENFMDTFYRPLNEALEFKNVYDEAEKGNSESIREVIRCYHEGDGVIACKAAAAAWEKKLDALK